jgi:hypothetical protein
VVHCGLAQSRVIVGFSSDVSRQARGHTPALVADIRRMSVTRSCAVRKGPVRGSLASDSDRDAILMY